jgi:hypothetical protein
LGLIVPAEGAFRPGETDTFPLVRRLAGIALALIFLVAVPAAAWGDPTTGQVMQFSLAASNGYTLQVKTEGTQSLVSLWRGTREFATTYHVGDTVEGSAIDADLGPRGRIHVQFQPSGRLVTVRAGNPECRLPRRLGTFTGTISFRGEEDYAAVDAFSAPGSVGPSPRAGCRGAKISSTSLPRLERRSIERVWTVSDAILMSRSPSSPKPSSSTLLLASAEGRTAQCLAYRIEAAGPKLTISRRAGVTGARSGFTYTQSLGSATIAPPEPFSGAATYSARRHRLSGDLAVEFPGLPPQPLTGPTFEARIDPVG